MREQFIHIDQYGDKFYFKDREMMVYHREDGPAIEWADGDKSWYINGMLHREDGPALEWANGLKAWFIDDEELTEEQFNARMNPVELTLDEIAAKFGVSVDRIKVKK